MRRFNQLGALLILVAALYFLWDYRFERVGGISTVRLEDLRKNTLPTPGVEWLGEPGSSKLRLRVNQGDPGVVTRFDLPGVGQADLLLLKYVVSSTNLRPGRELWEDGRCIIEWHSPDGGADLQNDLFCSARHDDRGELVEVVARSRHSPAVPALRLENLGWIGDLEVTSFEATVIRERMVWKIGRWVLMAALLAWSVGWVRARGAAGFVRPVCAGIIWLLMGIYFVVPGPWGFMRPFGTTFHIGGEAPKKEETAPLPVQPPASAPAVLRAQALPPVLATVGKIPEAGDITLRIKIYAQKARTFLHAVLLFGPTLLIACLVGRRSALSLGIILSLAIEAAQFAFGYGFDATDILDLTCDAVGIAAALFIHHHLRRRWPRLIAC